MNHLNSMNLGIIIVKRIAVGWVPFCKRAVFAKGFSNVMATMTVFQVHCYCCLVCGCRYVPLLDTFVTVRLINIDILNFMLWYCGGFRQPTSANPTYCVQYWKCNVALVWLQWRKSLHGFVELGKIFHNLLQYQHVVCIRTKAVSIRHVTLYWLMLYLFCKLLLL